MSGREHVYKTVEITGTSLAGMEDAVQRALDRASQTVQEMHWFEVREIRGRIEDNRIAHWQVTMKIGFEIKGRE